jgi:hypothetical protein
MRVKVFWKQGEDAHQKEYVVTDSTILDSGALGVYKTDGNNVFFNPHVWTRIEVDNSGR